MIPYIAVYGLRMPIYGSNLSQYGKIRQRIQAFFCAVLMIPCISIYGLRMSIYGSNLSQYGNIRERIQMFFAQCTLNTLVVKTTSRQHLKVT